MLHRDETEQVWVSIRMLASAKLWLQYLILSILVEYVLQIRYDR